MPWPWWNAVLRKMTASSGFFFILIKATSNTVTGLLCFFSVYYLFIYYSHICTHICTPYHSPATLIISSQCFLRPHLKSGTSAPWNVHKHWRATKTAWIHWSCKMDAYIRALQIARLSYGSETIWWANMANGRGFEGSLQHCCCCWGPNVISSSSIMLLDLTLLYL